MKGDLGSQVMGDSANTAGWFNYCQAGFSSSGGNLYKSFKTISKSIYRTVTKVSLPPLPPPPKKKKKLGLFRK